MKVTFLGTGTSMGVPAIGCKCETCTSTDPRDNRTRSSVYVQSGNTSWAIDTGPDFRSQCLREGIASLDAVLYTHGHTDHVMGFDDLRRFGHMLDGPLPVYASEPTMHEIRRVFDWAFDDNRRSHGYLHPDPHIVDGPFDIAEVTITPLDLPHGRTTVTGYLHSIGERPIFAYLSDCNDVPDAAIEQIREVDTLVLDGLRPTSHPTHLSIPEAVAMAERISPRRTFLTHLCCDVLHAKVDAELPANVHLAYDGLSLDLA